ncbi:hypothetical protein BER05_22770, partial [Escherichia coli]
MPTLHSFPPKDETFGAILTHRGKHRAQTFSVYLLAYRHGMRISELLDLHYQDLDLNEGRINIRRLK